MIVSNVAGSSIVISLETIANSNANIIVTWANTSSSLNSNGVISTSNTVTMSTVIDYSGYFARIANAVESIAANIAILSANVSSMANMANSVGITTRNYYDDFNAISTYQYLVEKGGILPNADTVGQDVQNQALQEVPNYKKIVRNL